MLAVWKYYATNFILFQFDFDVKFPLLCILLFLIDLKGTISPTRPFTIFREGSVQVRKYNDAPTKKHQ